MSSGGSSSILSALRRKLVRQERPKHTHALTQLLLAPATSILGGQRTGKRRSGLLRIAGALTAPHIFPNMTVDLPVEQRQCSIDGDRRASPRGIDHAVNVSHQGSRISSVALSGSKKSVPAGSAKPWPRYRNLDTGGTLASALPHSPRAAERMRPSSSSGCRRRDRAGIRTCRVRSSRSHCGRYKSS